MSDPAWHVTVFLGTRFAELQHHGTRWRAVLRHWSRHPQVAGLTVVDYPAFRPAPALVEPGPSWLPGVRCLRLQVPGCTRGGATDGVGWRLAARALRRAHRPPGRHLTIAATPLWAPLVPLVHADRRCFDAVDDWRALPSMSHTLRRIDRGYRSLGSLDVVTAVSDELCRRLADDYAVRSVAVPNGVDLDRYAHPAQAPTGLPTSPFAVYVGRVQERVDLDLLAATAARVPVVVAGAATGGAAEALRELPLTWLGPVDVDLVPGLLQRATVGLLPHRIDRLTTSMDPMKLLEYLAAGLSVVATDLPGVALSPSVHVATDFPDEVQRLLARPRAAAPDDAVTGRDWSAVAARLLDLCTGAA